MYSEAEMSIVIRSLRSIDYNHDYESIGPQLIGERHSVIAILIDRLYDRRPIPSPTWESSEGVRESWNGSGMDLYQAY